MYDMCVCEHFIMPKLSKTACEYLPENHPSRMQNSISVRQSHCPDGMQCLTGIQCNVFTGRPTQI